MKRYLLPIFCCLFASTIWAATPTQVKPQNLEPQATTTSLVNGANNFGFKLLQTIYSEKKNFNISISPLSLTTLLTLIYNGSANNTQKAIGTILGIYGQNLNSINQAHLDVSNKLQKLETDVQLLDANSLWIQKGMDLQPDFVTNAKKYFAAETYNVDLSAPKTLDAMNKWVKNHTNDKIQNLVDSMPPSVLVAINAVYFRGKWTEPFKRENTKIKPFYLADGTSTNVQMMSRFDTFNYFANNLFQAIALPYGKEKKIAMYLFLPKPKVKIEQIIAALTQTNWHTWLENFHSHLVAVEIPKFKIEFTAELNQELQALGMNKAFSPNTDFSGIAAGNLFISKLLHKTFIEVNEEQTEAAAVSAAFFGIGIPNEKPLEFNANHPFLYAIVDNATKAVIFIGVIAKPLQPN